MKIIEYTIKDELGIHARPAGLFVKEAGGFSAEITVKCKGKSANAKKIFALMGLGAKKGDMLEITISGSDEDAAYDALLSFLKQNL